MSSNGGHASKSLLNCHESLLIQMTVLLDLTIEHVACESFHGEVELVTPHILSNILHKMMRPVLEFMSMKIVVVLNSLQSMLEILRIQHWV